MASSGRGSRNKGSNYERAIAKKLTEFWGEGAFQRVPNSGGLHWGSDQRIAGDIIPPPEAQFPFVVECKKREGWTMDNVLLDNGQPREWWYQAVTDARRVKKTPMLIFSRNRAKDFVMLPFDSLIYDLLRHDGGVMRTTVSYENVQGELQSFDVMVMTFEAFTGVRKDTWKTYGHNINWDPYKDQYIHKVE